jgi:hypothetical protein
MSAIETFSKLAASLQSDASALFAFSSVLRPKQWPLLTPLLQEFNKKKTVSEVSLVAFGSTIDEAQLQAIRALPSVSKDQKDLVVDLVRELHVAKDKTG